MDKLKIDQSFIRDLLTDPDDAAIVRAIIQMAHGLKLRTIAEGVESEELCKLLALFQCDEIQGYCGHLPCRVRSYPHSSALTSRPTCSRDSSRPTRALTPRKAQSG